MILVTGGSGFIGRHLVKALADGDEDVRVLVRSRHAADRVKAAVAGLADPVSTAGGLAGVETVAGDVADVDSLQRAAAGARLVFHLAGPYRGTAAEFRATHVDGTANLLAALAPGTRLVYVSSTSVYGWDQAWPADEESPPNPSSAYGRAKLAAEVLVGGWGGGDAVVVRPTITYGPDDPGGMLTRAVRLMSRGVRLFPGSGENRVHLVHVDDLVRGLILAGRGGDGVYVMGGPHADRVRDILGLLAQGAGLPDPSFGLPAGALEPLGALAEAAWSATRRHGEPPITRHSLDVLTRDRAYSWAKAERELGWTPEIGIEDGVPPVGVAFVEARDARPPISPTASGVLGFDWRNYLEDEDEGLGTVYERFALDDVLAAAVERLGATSVIHAPAFGMMGFPGLDCVSLARTGVRVGLLDYDAERLAAVHDQWLELGLKPETHLVESADPSTWPDLLPTRYDLAFSFAALWWFEDADGVLAAQARWAEKGILCCVPNKNIFMRMRALLWHRSMFKQVNEAALDQRLVTRAGASAGLEKIGTGLFDIPPFPDTSVPLAKVLRARRGQTASEGDEAWSWSILPFLRGEDPGMKDRVARLARWERYLPGPIAPGLAHHRYVLLRRPQSGEGEGPGAGDAGAAAGAASQIQ
jgi:nucleoside-diphosphate-sugar epimerase